MEDGIEEGEEGEEVEDAPDAWAILESQRTRATDRMAETERRRADGEIDDHTADRLFHLYEAELVKAIEGQEHLAPMMAAPREATGESAKAGGPARLLTAWRIAAVALGFVAFVAVVGVAAWPKRTGSGVNASTSALAGRDLSTVTNEELEQVVAKNPDVPGMRIALVKRYLLSGSKADWPKARDHAHAALQSAKATAADKHEALVYLGWTTALTGRPIEGADLLQQALTDKPRDADALYFLGRVRLDLLQDPAGAVQSFEKALALDIPDDARTTLGTYLQNARTQVAGGTPPATTIAP